MLSKRHDCMPRQTVRLVQWPWLHATCDIIWPCVLSKFHFVMPCLTSSYYMCCPREMMTSHVWHHAVRSCVLSNLVYCPRAMMACQAKSRLTMCAVQGPLFHAMLDKNRPCVYYKGDDGTSCPTSSDLVCCPRNMMTGHARCRSTVCVVQVLWCKPRLTSSDHVCCPMATQAFHTQHCLTACEVQGW